MRLSPEITQEDKRAYMERFVFEELRLQMPFVRRDPSGRLDRFETPGAVVDRFETYCDERVPDDIALGPWIDAQLVLPVMFAEWLGCDILTVRALSA